MRRIALAAACLTAIVLVACEPAPIAGEGYSLVFEDNFDTLSRGPGQKWHNSHYLPTPPADAVYVENGLLNLVSRRSQGFPEVQLSTRGTSHNGADNFRFRYGYMEARLKGTAGDGSWPAFWTLTTTPNGASTARPTTARSTRWTAWGRGTTRRTSVSTRTRGAIASRTLTSTPSPPFRTGRRSSSRSREVDPRAG